MKSNELFRVGVVLTPGFSLMAFASLVEPLRGANLISGQTLYEWHHLSPEGGTVSSGGGLAVLTEPLPGTQGPTFDMVVVCGGMGSDTYRNTRLRSYLGRLARHNVIIGSASTASFILAACGLLTDRRCTVHWDYMEAFQEAYPRIRVTSDLFVIDRGIFTCAGGTSAMDVMLQMIRQRQGAEFASKVADQFVYGTIRQAKDDQRMSLRNRLGIVQPALVKAIEAMEGHVESPLRTPRLAKHAGVSTRQLERLFLQQFGRSPTKYYVMVRLEKARKLLRHSSLSVLEVGVSCGFTSASHFARAYRNQFGTSPSADRVPEMMTFDAASPAFRRDRTR
ncbi:GlxA family transcriptional regulator [Dongia sp.]|uniref:GlxA family transcriptional regulator n=1 Tax=Dongia sp. TaxID=1977262 RepID=UPI0035B1FC87